MPDLTSEYQMTQAEKTAFNAGKVIGEAKARCEIEALAEQVETARRWAVALEQENARLREMAGRLVKEWGAEQDHDLAMAERQNQAETANGAYQRGTTLEHCGDDLRQVLEHGALPDWVEVDDEPEPRKPDNRRRIYLDGKGRAWLSVATDVDGTEYIAPIDSPHNGDQPTGAVRETTGGLREIGRTW